ncbi:MAG: hypothetical protein A2Y15_07805 [Clostridiales bacterium GWF2_36_10]|nr:MAG: hypothetical protein A2Y15_07805 [Clostridiales bacterium GWF2_36_10]HAN22150.1 peptidase [Clostridiales bacterium]
MDGYKSVEDFIDAPSTVEFIIQKSYKLYEYIEKNPYILLTRELTGGYVVAYIDKKDINRALADLGSAFHGAESKVMGLLDQPSLNASGITQMQKDPILKLTGKGVLVGIVDTGIDYTNEVFRYKDGTSKIVSIFDQTVRSTTYQEFGIGTEYTQEQINLALASDDPYSIVPEQDTVGHGTFLASIAAGRQINNFTGAAPDAELIVVKLKKARPYYLEKYCVPKNQENAFSSAAVMIGIEYIIKKAEQLGRPVVICIGLGTNFGGHNGFSIFEQYLTLVAQQIGICVCVATGNESQAGHHFSGKLKNKDESQFVQVSVGENVGCVYLSMWNNISDKLSISITSPSGEKIDRIIAKPNSKYTGSFLFDKSSVIVEYYFPIRVTGGQNTEIKILRPSPGIWTICVCGDLVQEGNYHIYLPMTGFVDPSVKFVTPDPYFTTTIPATAVGIIDCGAYNVRNNNLCNESSWGPTRLFLITPDFVAPGVNVIGIFPNGFGTLSGTSVAAAITAGACALILQWGIVDENNVSISTYQIRAYLIQGAAQSPNIDYPNFQWGYGRLDLVKAYNIIKGQE